MDYKVDFERIAQESRAWRRSPTKEQEEFEMELFGELRNHEPRFKSFSKRLKYENRYEPAALWDEIFMSDDKERYKEELRRQNQAKLSRLLLKETAERLGVTKRAEDDDDIPLYYWYLIRSKPTSVTAASKNKQQLQLRKRNSIHLRVSIHPYTVRGHRRELETGTLQAHANGFRFSNYSTPFKMDVMYDNVKHPFFQDGDEEMAPFLHLHLHNPVKLGTETTKDIQFRLVQTFGERRRKGPRALDSDKLDKEEQKTVDNQLVQKFVWDVNFLWTSMASIVFQRLERNLRFRAELPMKRHTSLFFMTLYCLVHLRETPFLVVTLEEIEVVNLVLNLSGLEVFNMTIVFKDFGRDVHHINSIPSEYLHQIKEWLDLGRVKYYENEQDISDWQTKLKMITDDPKNFIEGGGWELLLNSAENANQYADSSEESLANYSDMSSEESDYESDSGPKDNEKSMARTKLTPPVIRRVNVVMSDESDS